MEPCGTPRIISNQLLNIEPSLTRCFRPLKGEVHSKNAP